MQSFPEIPGEIRWKFRRLCHPLVAGVRFDCNARALEGMVTMKEFFLGISLCLFILAFVNFTLFWSVSLCLGGDALNGKIENGHYYLANHGELKEVSEATWNYSYYHSVSVLITHPLGIGSMALAHKLVDREESG